jgi:DegV family protein with EDD domain
MVFSIVTDSASDILPETRENYTVYVVPTMVMFGREEFDDDKLSKTEFLSRIAQGKIPTTSQPSPENYLKFYQMAMEESETNEVLGIHISSKLSGTFNGAVSTRNMIEEGTIRLVDSLSVSVGSGYLVYLATQLREQGYSLEETAQKLESVREDIYLQVVIENVQHLRRSGRINLTIFALLSLFGLKPIIYLEDGKLVRNGISFGKTRGIKKAAKFVRNNINPKDRPVVVYGYADTPEDLPFLHQQFENYIFSRSIDIDVCTTLMAHAGPGVVGILVGPSVEYVKNNY